MKRLSREPGSVLAFFRLFFVKRQPGRRAVLCGFGGDRLRSIATSLGERVIVGEAFHAFGETYTVEAVGFEGDRLVVHLV